MTKEYRERLEEVGIDWNAALERFMGNEELYLKFLRKFPEDNSFPCLQEAMQEENIEEAFKAAHTLKGVTGNLSINSLYELLLPFVELLRAKNIQDTKEIWPQIVVVYECAIDVIRKENT